MNLRRSRSLFCLSKSLLPENCGRSCWKVKHQQRKVTRGQHIGRFRNVHICQKSIFWTVGPLGWYSFQRISFWALDTMFTWEKLEKHWASNHVLEYTTNAQVYKLIAFIRGHFNSLNEIFVSLSKFTTIRFKILRFDYQPILLY